MQTPCDEALHSQPNIHGLDTENNSIRPSGGKGNKKWGVKLGNEDLGWCSSGNQGHKRGRLDV